MHNSIYTMKCEADILDAKRFQKSIHFSALMFVDGKHLDIQG